MAARAAAAANPQELIIAATEQLLAEQGPHKTTVRAITQAAGVNVAAINYHFESRDGLMIAICARHMRSANEAIIKQLEDLDVSRGTASVRAIFEPLVSTALQVWMHDEVLRGLRSFIFVDAQLAQKLNVSEMTDVYEQMHDALARACPALSRTQIRRRFQFAMATIMQMVRSHDAGARRGSSKELAAELVSFLVGGFVADL